MNVEHIIRAQIAEETAPITASQFAQYRKQVDAVFNFLQQQIISLDVTCGLLMESQQLEPETFKAEVARRVKAVADGMLQQQKEVQEVQEEKKVSLV